MASRKGSNTSYHLLNEQPLLVSPSLAVLFGLAEAMVLQQLHFWLQTNPHRHDGRPWIYNTYKQWQAKFPFWSWETMKRALRHLEKEGVVEAANFNRNPIDKTKWYTINYEKLNSLDIPPTDNAEPSTAKNEPSTAHNEPSNGQNLAIQRLNFSHLPERSPERSSEDNPSPLPSGEAPSPHRKASRRCPAEFAPSAKTRQWAAEQFPGVPFDEALDAMRDCEFKDAHRDWDAVLKTWIRREDKMYRRAGPPPRAPTNGVLGDKGEITYANAQLVRARRQAHGADRREQRRLSEPSRQDE